MRRQAPLVLNGQTPSFVAGSPLTTPHSHAWCAAAITEHGDDYLGTAPVSSTEKFVEMIYDLLRGGGRRRPARDPLPAMANDRRGIGGRCRRTSFASRDDLIPSWTEPARDRSRT